MQRPSMGWARAFTKLLGAAQAVCSEDRVRCVRGGRRAPPALRTNHLEPPDAVSGTSDAWTPRVRRPWAALAPVPPLRIHSDASLPVKLQGRPPRPALWRQRRCVGIVGDIKCWPRLRAQGRPGPLRARKCGFPRCVATRASNKEREPHRLHDRAGKASWGGIKCWPRLRAQDRPEPCWFE